MCQPQMILIYQKKKTKYRINSIKEIIMNTVMIDGKDYDVAKLSPELQNYLVVRQEIQASKIRHNLELEKIDVLTAHYNKKIAELVKKEVPEEK